MIESPYSEWQLCLPRGRPRLMISQPKEIALHCVPGPDWLTKKDVRNGQGDSEMDEESMECGMGKVEVRDFIPTRL